MYSCFFLAFSCSLLQGQPHLDILEKNRGKSFREIVRQVEIYYSDKEKGQGSGYKQFKRWQYLHETRLDENGYLSGIDPVIETSGNGSRIRSSTDSPIWKPLGPFSYDRIGRGNNGGLGRINCLVADPADSSLIYAGTPAGGLWRTRDAGVTWEPMSDQIPSLGISSIVIDPSSPADKRTIYILTGDGDGAHTFSTGVMKSTDGGLSWKKTQLFFPIQQNVRGYKMIMHPENPETLLVATTHGVYKTISAGRRWQLKLPGTFRDLEFHPTQPRYVYASGINRIYRSETSGREWHAVLAGLPDSTELSYRVALAVSPEDPDRLYAVYGGNSKYQGVFMSRDRGKTFELRSESPNIIGYNSNGAGTASQGLYDLVIAASPSNADEVYVGGINVWKSRNGGASWTVTGTWQERTARIGKYVHADQHALEFIGSGLYAGNDGGVFVTWDQGLSWTDRSQGLQITQIYKFGQSFSDSSRFVFGTQDNGMNLMNGKRNDHWLGGDGNYGFFDPSDESLFFGSIQFGILYQGILEGQSIRGITPGGAGTGRFVTPFIMGPAARLYAGYTDVWKGIKGEFTYEWTNISDGKTGSGLIRFLAIAPSDSTVIYAAKNTREIYVTTNHGTDWELNPIPVEQPVTSIVVDPINPSHLWVAVGGYSFKRKVFESWNRGRTWLNISQNLPNRPALSLVYDEKSGTLYLGTEIGVFSLQSGQDTWVNNSVGLPASPVNDLAIFRPLNQLRAATFGRGIWELDLDAELDSPTAQSEMISQNFDLYPNPAGNELTIQWEREGTYKILIRNSLGNLVYAGETNKNLRNAVIDLSELPGGTYFLTFSGKNSRHTRRLVLIH